MCMFLNHGIARARGLSPVATHRTLGELILPGLCQFGSYLLGLPLLGSPSSSMSTFGTNVGGCLSCGSLGALGFLAALLVGVFRLTFGAVIGALLNIVLPTSHRTPFPPAKERAGFRSAAFLAGSSSV